MKNERSSVDLQRDRNERLTIIILNKRKKIKFYIKYFFNSNKDFIFTSSNKGNSPPPITEANKNLQL